MGEGEGDNRGVKKNMVSATPVIFSILFEIEQLVTCRFLLGFSARDCICRRTGQKSEYLFVYYDRQG